MSTVAALTESVGLVVDSLSSDPAAGGGYWSAEQDYAVEASGGGLKRRLAHGQGQ